MNGEYSVLFVSIIVIFITLFILIPVVIDEQKEKGQKELKDDEKKEKSPRNDAVAELFLAKGRSLEKFDSALTFSTYELAEIVINLVDLNSYDKLKDVASVLTDPTHIDEVLSDASKMLTEGYESAIKEIATTRCVDINYQEETVSKKLAALVASCVAIGRGAIGKKIGMVVSAVDSTVAKGAIRKTKKWEA